MLVRLPAPIMITLRSSLLFSTSLFLLACSSAPPAAPAQAGDPPPASAKAPELPAEVWRAEAMTLLAEISKQPPNEFDSYPRQLNDILNKPDPAAVVGPSVKILPTGKEAFQWPAPKAGVLTIRYRIEKRDCAPGGSDMGCHLVALCPVDAPDSKAPIARIVGSEYIMPQPIPELHVEKLEVPSDRCELRLYARDHHGSKVCTARGPAITAPKDGSQVIDLGTLGTEGVSCERDVLAERMVFRHELVTRAERRKAKKP